MTAFGSRVGEKDKIHPSQNRSNIHLKILTRENMLIVRTNDSQL
jgi:hypothetical protein